MSGVRRSGSRERCRVDRLVRSGGCCGAGAACGARTRDLSPAVREALIPAEPRRRPPLGEGRNVRFVPLGDLLGCLVGIDDVLGDAAPAGDVVSLLDGPLTDSLGV